MRALMPQTKRTFAENGKAEGWVGELYVHLTVTELAPGQYSASGKVPFLWSGNDGNLTILESGDLEVRFPSNGIVEYWRREDGRALEIKARSEMKWRNSRKSDTRSIKLVFRRVCAFMFQNERFTFCC